MIDVHPPTEPIHGWRDFFLHLTTITIGLLIALGLEGCVSWQHHRHLVHEAEASLRVEIQSNADGLANVQASVHQEQASLRQDVDVLKQMMRDPKMKSDNRLEISFHIAGFDNVSWKTAQSTGALSYMPYTRAQEYSAIYGLQDDLDSAQKQAARDAVVSIGSIVSVLADGPGDIPPTQQQLQSGRQLIEVLQGQLRLVDSELTALNTQYKKFLDAHPA